jgi:hypothetical protein
MADETMNHFGQQWGAFLAFLVTSWFVFAIFSGLSPALSKRFFSQEHGYGTLHQRLTEWTTHKDSIDVLIVGPSVAYRSFHPKPFEEAGIQIFNLGTDSQTLPVTANILSHALEESNPRLVIIPMFSDLWNQKATESRSNWIVHNQIQNWNWIRLSLEMCLKEASPKLLLQWMHSKTKALATDSFKFLRKNESDIYLHSGYTGSSLSLESLPECNQFAAPRIATRRYVYDAIDQIEEICLQANVKLLLIWTPTLCNRDFVFDNHSTQQIDGNQWPKKTESGMFFDESHLTTHGALSYSHWLLNLEAFKHALQQP